MQSPIEELRSRLSRVAARRGFGSPSTLRVSQLLDRFVNEWYRAASPATITAQFLRIPPGLSAADLLRRCEQAAAKRDSHLLAALLPLVMELPKELPQRPAMLIAAARLVQTLPGSMPLACLALEEASATAPQHSLLQLEALSLLAGCYLQAGRVHAAFYLARSVIRNRAAFPADPSLSGALLLSFAGSARRRGKDRLARQALLMAALDQTFDSHLQEIITLELYILDNLRLTLTALKSRFQALYAGSRYQPHLLGSYASGLLRHGHPRAAIAVVSRALSAIVRDRPHDWISQVDLYLILSAASQQVGQTIPAQAFLVRARDLLGNDDAHMLARRLSHWQRAAHPSSKP